MQFAVRESKLNRFHIPFKLYTRDLMHIATKLIYTDNIACAMREYLWTI